MNDQSAKADAAQFEAVPVPILYVVDRDDWANLQQKVILQAHLVNELCREVDALKQEVSNLRMALSDHLAETHEADE